MWNINTNLPTHEETVKLYSTFIKSTAFFQLKSLQKLYTSSDEIIDTHTNTQCILTTNNIMIVWYQHFYM